MKWYKKQLKNQQNTPKLGPSFFVKGDKKMMLMTRPIDSFLFGFDQILATIKPHLETSSQDASFSNLFSATLNSLIADVLNYFQNRLRVSLGKEKVSVTSIPDGKASFKKHFNELDIKTLIGDKGYQELKKLDEVRGNFQHGNDRYFIDFRVNGYTINTAKELVKYTEKIKKVMLELDEKLEALHPTYHQEIIQEPGKTTITMQAIGHSFDITKMKVNKKPENEGNSTEINTEQG